jgi:uncharacterized protein (DUF302 family)
MGKLRFQTGREVVIRAMAGMLAAAGLATSVYLVAARNPIPAINKQPQENSMTPDPNTADPSAPNPNNGIVTRTSRHSVDETVQKLEGILQAKGVKLFAVIDHSGEAASVGLSMRPTKLLIFGNPKAGTPLMLASPTAAIDLPLKILVWEDGEGQVSISYNSAAYLQHRHAIPAELIPNIAVVEALAAAAAE